MSPISCSRQEGRSLTLAGVGVAVESCAARCDRGRKEREVVEHLDFRIRDSPAFYVSSRSRQCLTALCCWNVVSARLVMSAVFASCTPARCSIAPRSTRFANGRFGQRVSEAFPRKLSSMSRSGFDNPYRRRSGKTVTAPSLSSLALRLCSFLSASIDGSTARRAVARPLTHCLNCHFQAIDHTQREAEAS